ncbi:MAG: hypothetical protein R3F13_00230 [Prosthecobacter sp.]
MSAMTGIEHHRIEELGVLDVAGAEHGVDELAEIKTREQGLALVGLHRETEDELDVVDQHLLGSHGGLDHKFRRADPEVIAIQPESGESVERIVEVPDAVRRHVVAPADFDYFPAAA